MPDQLTKNMQKALKNLKVSDLTKVQEVKPPFDKELDKLAETMKKRIQKKEMGGEVIDMTKSQPVSMMEEGGSAVSDADVSKAKKMLVKKSNLSEADIQRMEEMLGKVKTKKMNMGGVVPGRGGKFKGVR